MCSFDCLYLLRFWLEVAGISTAAPTKLLSYPKALCTQPCLFVIVLKSERSVLVPPGKRGSSDLGRCQRWICGGKWKDVDDDNGEDLVIRDASVAE